MSIKRLENLLNPNDHGDLGDILRRARDMDTLLRTLRQALPADIAANVVAANIRDAGELVVFATSQAWAARLRFEAQALVDAAVNAGADVSSCKVRVSQQAT